MAATVALKAALPVSLKDAVVNPDNSSEYELDTAVRSEGDGFTVGCFVGCISLGTEVG